MRTGFVFPSGTGSGSLCRESLLFHHPLECSSSLSVAVGFPELVPPSPFLSSGRGPRGIASVITGLLLSVPRKSSHTQTLDSGKTFVR